MFAMTIYALCDPRNGRVRYIGKAVRPNIRFSQHLREASRGHASYKCNWIRSVGTPTLKILCECDGDGADEERYQIWLARRSGESLTNSTDGGDGALGGRRTIETRRLMSELAKARLATRPKEKRDAHAAAISKFFSGRKQRPEVIARRQATRRGYRHSPETGRKISAALTGRHHTEEHRAKIGAAGRGIKDSPESVAKRISGMLKTRYGIERTLTAEDMRNPKRYQRTGPMIGEKNKAAKVTADIVRAMIARYREGGITVAAVGQLFGVGRSQAWNIVHRKSWLHLNID